MATSTAQAPAEIDEGPSVGRPRALDLVERFGPGAASWGLPFILVVYLGLKAGGFDPIVRSEVGIVVWWLVVVGAAIGVLPTTRLRRPGWIGLGLLTGFAAWTGLGIIWSDNSEASVTEFVRVATYLGVFALVLTARRPGDTRRVVNGLACGMALIGILALLSRLHPSWFPDVAAPDLLQSKRLRYPLGYWNGLAALMAMTVPLLLFLAITARTIAGRAAAAAALPAILLTALFTLSRGGIFEIGVGLVVLMLLAPRRFSVLPSLLLTAVGSAILVIATSRREALTDFPNTAAAHHQGDQMLVLTILVCALVAVGQIAIALADRRGLGPRIEVPRHVARPAAGLAAIVALIIALGAGGPQYLSDRWEGFKQLTPTDSGVGRFDSSTGSGRYQTWDAAVDANATAPLIGIGPGTYVNWWAKERPIALSAQDAHSLYIESLGELGIVGFLLVSGFVVAVLVVGGRRALSGDPERRWPYVAATASAAACAAAAGIDWVWELSVLPVAFMFLAGGLLASRRYRPADEREQVVARSVLVALGLVAIVSATIPLLGAKSIRDSQAAWRSGDLSAALDDADNAHSLQPYAATPEVQRALVFEAMQNYGAGVAAAREATRADGDNWSTWLLLSRLEHERGDADASTAAYLKAKSLNPKSPLFAGG